MKKRRARAAIMLLLMTWMLVACGGNTPRSNRIFLMPAPEVYEEGKVDPFLELGPLAEGRHPGILFATDRKPAGPDDKK